MHLSDERMTIEKAKAFPMPIGKYKGWPLDHIAEDDEGLLYLDWLRGWIEGKDFGELHEALRVYLDDPTIAGDLKELLR